MCWISWPISWYYATAKSFKAISNTSGYNSCWWRTETVHLFLKKKFAVVMGRGGYLKLSKVNKKLFCCVFCFFFTSKIYFREQCYKKNGCVWVRLRFHACFNLLCVVAIWQKIKNSSAYQPVFWLTGHWSQNVIYILYLDQCSCLAKLNIIHSQP